MSANATSLSASFRAADTATSAFTWGGYARLGLLTIGAAVVANAVFFYLGGVNEQVPRVKSKDGLESEDLLCSSTVGRSRVVGRGERPSPHL